MDALDPVRARRAQVGRAAALARKAGFALFGAACLAFLVGAVGELTDGLVTVIVACLVVGSLLLAPAIVLGYAVKAAEREDRARGV